VPLVVLPTSELPTVVMLLGVLGPRRVACCHTLWGVGLGKSLRGHGGSLCCWGEEGEGEDRLRIDDKEEHAATVSRRVGLGECLAFSKCVCMHPRTRVCAFAVHF